MTARRHALLARQLDQACIDGMGWPLHRFVPVLRPPHLPRRSVHRRLIRSRPESLTPGSTASTAGTGFCYTLCYNAAARADESGAAGRELRRWSLRGPQPAIHDPREAHGGRNLEGGKQPEEPPLSVSSRPAVLYMACLSRVFVLVATVLLVAEMSGGAALVASGCETACEDDDEGAPGDDCTPDCSDCACCPHAQPAALPAVSPVVPLAAVDSAEHEQSVIFARGEPREILHVPRRAA
jgi:hypothetical protein